MRNLKQVNSKLDLVAWSIIVLATVGTVLFTYFYNLSGPVYSLVWLGWLVLTITFGYFTPFGKRVFEFARESKVELQKVVWPTRQETVQTTLIVMIMVLIAGLLLWLIDTGMIWVIGKTTRLG